MSSGLACVRPMSSWGLALMLGGAAFTATAQTAPIQPGSLPGSFSVTANGDSQYTLSIEAPPGIHGAHPQLSLEYSSNQGNGRVGVGWDLKGLSSLYRCKASPAFDGFNGTIQYNSNDRFCLDGQRLININGAYGVGAQYRTALETWRNVQASQAACGVGPCSFTVTASNGAKWSYGTTTDSRILATGRQDVRVWAVSQIQDLNGNTVSFTYSNNPVGGGGQGQYYVSRIDYTANQAQTTSANRSIRFVYQNRSDVESRYQGGGVITTSYLLANVQTFVGAQIVRDYRLAYATSGASGRSELQNVRACADGTSSAACVTATNFAWQGSAAVQYTKANLQASMPNTFSQLIPADVSGDGLGDLVAVSQPQGTGKSQVRVYRSTGSDLQACPTPIFLNTTGTVTPMDVNGDGRMDLVQLTMQGAQHVLLWYLGQADGCTFQYAGTYGTQLPAVGTSVWPMDVNGDGRTDLVEGSQQGQNFTITVFLSVGNGFTVASTRTIALGSSQPIFQPMDVNGDGMTDLVQIWPTSNGTASRLTTYFSNGTNFNASIDTPVQASSGSTNFLPVDINGDGNVDLVQIWTQSGAMELTPFTSDGLGRFVAGATVNSGRAFAGSLTVWAMDAKGAGKTDLVQAWKDANGALRLALYSNLGNTFDTGTDLGVQLSASDFNTTEPIDISGAGRMQVLQGWVNGANLQFTQFGTLQPALDRISAISDGMGNRTTINYLPMSDTRVYAASAPTGYPNAPVLGYSYRQAPAQFPYQPVSGGKLHLVWQYTNQNSSPNAVSPYAYTYTMKYSAAQMDLTGHGWEGFASVARLDNQTGELRTDFYNQLYPLTGTVSATQYACTVQQVTSPDPLCPAAGATLMSVGSTGYQQVATAKGVNAPYPSVYLVQKSNVRFDSYTYGKYNSSRGKIFQYDNYGETTLLSDLGYVDQQGHDLAANDNVYTCTNYNPVSPGNWAIGYPIDIKVSSASPCNNYTSFTDGTDFSLEHTAYTAAMQVLTQSAWDSANKVNLTTSFQYDGFGNTVLSTEPGNRATIFAFDSTFHTYAVTVTSPPNNAGTKLVAHYAYDPRFGVVGGYQDPNGLVSVNCIGSLGEVQATQSPVPNFVAMTPDASCMGMQTSDSSNNFAKANVVTVETQSMSSDPDGGVSMQVNQLQNWNSGTTRVNRFQLSHYDGLGRVFETVDQGQASTGNSVICRSFDSNDRETRESLAYYFNGNEDDCGLKQNDPRFWINMSYDAYGRMVRAVSPAGSTGKEQSITTTSYPADNTSVVTMAAGDPYQIQKTLTYSYFDSVRKLVTMSAAGASGGTTSYAYDRIGRMTSVVDPPTPSNPQGVNNSITYDSLNRRSTLNNPDQNTQTQGVASQWTFDSQTGFMRSLTDAKGQKTQYTYDLMGRVLTQSMSDGSTLKYVYDDPGTNYSLGRLTRVQKFASNNPAPQFTYQYGFDTEGQRASQTLAMQGYGPYQTQWQYDPLSRMAQMIYPDQSVIQQQYVMGNLAQTSLGGAVYATYSQYTPLGMAQQIAFGNGVSAAYSYSPTGDVNTALVQGPQQQPLLNQTVSWDHLSEVTRVVDNLKLGVDYSQSFSHELGRLKQAVAGGLYGTVNYSYDPSGNLTQQNGTTYSYAAHRVLSGINGSQSVFTASYDPNGNIESRQNGAGAWKYTYDPMNRLQQAVLNGSTVFSVPITDQNGSRLMKNDGQNVTSVYGATDYVVTNFNGTATLATRYLRSETGTVAAITNTISGQSPGNPGSGYPTPGTLYYVSDYLGTTQLTTAADGTVVSRFAYAPYGAIISPGTTGPDNVRQKLQDKELDESTGLYDFGARYYDPVVGRFTSPDTRLGSDVEQVDSLNRFAFALNDPLSHRDMTGHDIVDSIVGDLLGALETLAGVVVDVVSEGALEPLGQALIGGGSNALLYGIQDSKNFSWKQYGIQEGVGVAMGLLVPGFGEGGEEAGAMTEEAASAGGAAESGGGRAEAEGGAASADAFSGAARSGGQEIGAASGQETERASFGLEGSALENSEMSEGRVASDEEHSALTSEEDSTGQAETESDQDESDCTIASSFPAGTVVAGWKRRQPIETVGAGDLLYGWDPKMGSAHFFKVLHTEKVRSESLIALRVEGKTIESAPAQMYWVEGSGWKPAWRIAAGDRLHDETGQSRPVQETFQRHGDFSLYEMEVADAHTFFASQDALLVHNTPGKKKSCREVAMGKTPGKNSRSGKDVFKRWKSKNKARIGTGGKKEVFVRKTATGARKWVALDAKIHMGHIEDAVDWWNSGGWTHGAKAKPVRQFMLNSDNYRFEWGPLNSSNGAKLGQTYKRPSGWTGAWPP